MTSQHPNEAKRTDSPISAQAWYVRLHVGLLGIGIIFVGLATLRINSQLLKRTLELPRDHAQDLIVQDAAQLLFLVSMILAVFGLLVIFQVRWFILRTPIACGIGLALIGAFSVYNYWVEIYSAVWMGIYLALGMTGVIIWNLLVLRIFQRLEFERPKVAKPPPVAQPTVLYQGKEVNVYLIWAHERRQWLLSWSWSILGVLLILGTIPAAIFLPEESEISLIGWLFICYLEGLSILVCYGLTSLAKMLTRGSQSAGFISLGLAYSIPVLGLVCLTILPALGPFEDAACILLVASLVVGGPFFVLTLALLWVRRKMVAANLPLGLRMKDLHAKGSEVNVLRIVAPIQAKVLRFLWRCRWLFLAGTGVCLVLLSVRAWNTYQRVVYLHDLEEKSMFLLEARFVPVDNFLEHFFGMRRVQGVQFSTRWISREDFTSFTSLTKLGLLPELETLSLRGQQITKDDLAVIGRLRELRSLDLAGTSVHDDTLDLMGGLQKLEFLALSATTVSDAAIPTLSRLTQLRELHIEDTDISKAGVEKLTSLLPGTRILGKQTPSLAHRQTIVDLLSQGASVFSSNGEELSIYVYEGGLRENVFSRVSQLQRPHVLELHRLDVAPWIEEIGKDHFLKRLELHTCTISEGSLKPLSHAKKLRELRVEFTLVQETFRELRHLPQLETLEVVGDKLQPSEWTPLEELRELKKLSVRSCSFGDPDIALLKGNTNLQSLDISHCPVTEVGIAQLPKICPQLEFLKLNSPLLTSDAVKNLQRLHGLKEMQIVRMFPETVDLPVLRAKLPGCKIDFQ